MECREARLMVSHVLDGSADTAKLEDFLWHIENCSSCREELMYGLNLQQALDSLDENVDYELESSEASFHKLIQRIKTRIFLYDRYRRFKWMIYTCGFWALVFAVVMQMMHWHSMGFLFF